MSSCTVAISNSPVFSPSSSSSPHLAWLNKPRSRIRALAGSESSPVLKRKRPPRLDIPVAEKVTAEVVVVQEVAVVEGEGYSVCCKRGRKEVMEDRFSAVLGLQGDQKQAFFGVFDGHGGTSAAEFAAENLGKNIINELKRSVDEDDSKIELAVKGGYLATDSEFLKKDVRGGACSVTALIVEGNLVVSNAGDCRAVVSRGGVAEALTSDHRPCREDERERIEKLGGFVERRNGVWRVLGSLAVSRSIGDRYLKQWITAEPETKSIRLEPGHEFLILASDGLWDKVSNQEAIDIARPLCKDVEKPQPLLACRKLVDLSVSRGSADDVSVMIIHLGRFF